jgi:hypothetical protein
MNKLYIFYFLFLFAQLNIYAQTKKPKPSPVATLKETMTPMVTFGKNNVVYVNIDNPMLVDIDGVPPSEVQVTCDDASLIINSIEGNRYLVRPTLPGDFTLNIQSKIDWRSTTYLVSAKLPPAPTPSVMLNNNNLRKGGEIAANVFKGATALLAQIENFDFEAKCVVTGFKVTHIAKKAEPIVIENQGPMFSPNLVATIKNAKAGDLFIFDTIKAKLSGDLEPKPIAGTIAYFIK